MSTLNDSTETDKPPWLVRRIGIIVFFVVIGLVGLYTPSATAGIHVVKKGQTLWKISRRYKCKMAVIQKANRMTSTLLRPGQRLRVPCKRKRRKRRTKVAKIQTPQPVVEIPSFMADLAPGKRIPVVSARLKKPIPQVSAVGISPNTTWQKIYEVKSGDTLADIASIHGTTAGAIKRQNDLLSDMVLPGQRIKVGPVQSSAFDLPKVSSSLPLRGIQSIGAPNSGRLRNASRMVSKEGYYYIRRKHRSWATNHTIYYLTNAIRNVHTQLPNLHVLSIGDLSAENGGPIRPHKSHQTGRDADIGLFFKRPSPGYPKNFMRAKVGALNLQATWTLIRQLAATRGKPGGIQYMFLDYALQEELYEYAIDNGHTEASLSRIFQYPRSKRVRVGLIRHERGHDTHIHVRFSCLPTNSRCRQ